MGNFPGDGYRRNLLTCLMQSTLNGYTKCSYITFGGCKVTNIFSTGKIFFCPPYRAALFTSRQSSPARSPSWVVATR